MLRHDMVNQANRAHYILELPMDLSFQIERSNLMVWMLACAISTTRLTLSMQRAIIASQPNSTISHKSVVCYSFA